MQHFVYVLWSDKFSRKYVGMTQNLDKRLAEHNSGKTTSTKPFIPWKIIYSEIFDNRLHARNREIYFKTAAGRRFLGKWIPARLKDVSRSGGE